MATQATLNTWLDQLSSSILLANETSPSKQEWKRVQDSFRRRVKRHNYGRTNQFEVTERLDGLEEKFQILTLDNLSDALRQRRNELRLFEYHWLPDILDLFLHLSGDPARSERLLELYRVPPRTRTPPLLRWKDIIADDPIDHKDRLWRVPDFRDTDASEYDNDDLSVSTPSPPSIRNRDGPAHTGLLPQVDLLYSVSNEHIEAQIKDIGSSSDQSNVLEVYFVRQALFTLRGFPSPLFVGKPNGYILKPTVCVHGIPSSTLQIAARRITAIRNRTDTIRGWMNSKSEAAFVDAMKCAAERVLRDFDRRIDELQQDLLKNDNLVVGSISATVSATEPMSIPVATVADFLRDTRQDDAISCLEKLYAMSLTAQLTYQLEAYQTLTAMLVPSLQAYLQPIWAWLEHGELEQQTSAFFIKVRSTTSARHRLWHDRYELQMSGPSRPPTFLINTAEDVLACGKTSAFLSSLWHHRSAMTTDIRIADSINNLLQTLHADLLVPFAAIFENAWQEELTHLLKFRTETLKSVLATRCGFEETFDALGQVYLRQDHVLFDKIETKLFDRIDRCMDSWNDRFQLRDMLEDNFSARNEHQIVDSITIHSAYTSSRSMQSRRKSVKILSALAFEYVLSWPIANIIDEASMTAYRRVSLILMQIRRAKYSLERVGFLSVMAIPLDDDATSVDQRSAQVLAFTLVNVINTIYDHFMTTTVTPLTQSMHTAMREAPTLGEMIAAHKSYIVRLEHSCLAASKVQLLRQTLIALLDLCIHFSDLVSNSTKAQHIDSDHEASSFVSALSRNKVLRADQYGLDSEDDEDGHIEEGYSSFIVLDADTSIVKELRKVEIHFKKQLKFFIAGLRGVARAGQHVQDLDLLADRLTWGQEL